MKFVEYSAHLTDGIVTIELDKPCNCYVALVEISMANFNKKSASQNVINISCDQIDSTYENPNRSLRRVPFSRYNTNAYVTWVEKFLQMKKVDSNDKFLTLRFSRAMGEPTISFVKDNTIFFTLVYSESSDSEMWTTYI